MVPLYSPQLQKIPHTSLTTDRTAIFFAFTGFEEPESIFIFRPGQKSESTLFVRKKDPKLEMWDGYRFGPQGAVSEFAMDEAHPIDEFSDIAPKLLNDCSLIYNSLGQNEAMDSLVKSTLKQVQRSQGRSGIGLQTIVDPQEILGETRIKKDEYSMAMIKEATRITSESHIEVMKSVRPKSQRGRCTVYLSMRLCLVEPLVKATPLS